MSAIEARIVRLITGTDRGQRSRDLAWLWENGDDMVRGIIRIGRHRGDSEEEIIRAVRTSREVFAISCGGRTTYHPAQSLHEAVESRFGQGARLEGTSIVVSTEGKRWVFLNSEPPAPERGPWKPKPHATETWTETGKTDGNQRLILYRGKEVVAENVVVTTVDVAVARRAA